MAQQNKRYSFADVGETVQEFNETNRQFNATQPINIQTPISLDRTKKNTFVMHYDFLKSTRDNLRNLINTNKGERLMFPDFGANIQELAWEVGTEDGDQKIMERVKNTVSLFMPYIQLDGYEPIRTTNIDGEERVGVRIFFLVPGVTQKVQGLEVYLNTSG